MSDLRPPFRQRYPSPISELDFEWASDLVRALTIRDREVNNALTMVELSKTFAIDDTGMVTITIDNVFGFTPTTAHCQVSIVTETEVEDWGYDLLTVYSINATQVVVKVNRTTASTTVGALARVVVWVRP